MNYVDYSKIEISSNGRNVRFYGRALDKCGIASLIHHIAKKPYVLWSDIYYADSTKKELVDYLKTFLPYYKFY